LRGGPIRRAALAVAWAACIAALSGLTVEAQNLPAGGLAVHGVPQPLTQPSSERADDRPSAPIADGKLLQALNEDRHKKIVSDTDKLLRLANELNLEIARSDADSLSPGQLHEVAEIEKLAHQVKEKMRMSGTK